MITQRQIDTNEHILFVLNNDYKNHIKDKNNVIYYFDDVEEAYQIIKEKFGHYFAIYIDTSDACGIEIMNIFKKSMETK